MTKEEKEAIEYFKDKEVSFEVDFDKAVLLKALGIEETEEDSFDKCVFRIDTLINLILKLKKENEELKEIKRQKLDEYLHNNLWICRDLAQNYIHKSVIENKLAEAEKEYREIQSKKYRDAGISENRVKAKIEVYKEILKKEREEE